MSYVTDAGKIAEVQDKINGLTVSEGNSLTLPFEEISSLVNSEVVDKKNLRTKCIIVPQFEFFQFRDG